MLAGGTGGAKLARGLRDRCALTVIANTGDDVEVHGGYVSPDPDLVTFWLADRIDERGWGIEGDSFRVMDGLRKLGEEVWFNLGDEDLALCLHRARRLAAGERLTTITEDVARRYGAGARVLPMCDERVRTVVNGLPFQDFMIRARGARVDSVRFDGTGRLTPEAAEAIAAADAVVIGPSNPIISIGPILAVDGMRAALAPKHVIAVSPLVGGAVLKGPTAEFLRWAGKRVGALYAGLADVLVADEPAPELPTHVTDVLMADAGRRERLAAEVLRLIGSRQ